MPKNEDHMEQIVVIPVIKTLDQKEYSLYSMSQNGELLESYIIDPITEEAFIAAFITNLMEYRANVGLTQNGFDTNPTTMLCCIPNNMAILNNTYVKKYVVKSPGNVDLKYIKIVFDINFYVSNNLIDISLDVWLKHESVFLAIGQKIYFIHELEETLFFLNIKDI